MSNRYPAAVARTRLIALSLLLAAPGLSTAEYPPPPGPYSLVPFVPPEATADVGRTAPADTPQRPGLMMPGDDAGAAYQGAYDGNTLFGAAPATPTPIPAGVDSAAPPATAGRPYVQGQIGGDPIDAFRPGPDGYPSTAPVAGYGGGMPPYPAIPPAYPPGPADIPLTAGAPSGYPTAPAGVYAEPPVDSGMPVFRPRNSGR